MEKTNYGFKKTGNSRFVIIAPHAAGDDIKTSIVTKKIAKQLDAFLIINKKYFKPTNSRAKKYPEKVEDFNKLRWSSIRKKYLWKRKNPDMKLFFQNIKDYCNQAKELNKNKKAIAVYIHGFKSDEIGIDIGAGIKRDKKANKFFGSRRHNGIGKNSGEITTKISILKKIKKDLKIEINKKYNLNITIGENYTGWSKQSAIQFHKHADCNDYALQFEISHLFRNNKKNIDYISNLISQTLLNNFK